VTSDKITSKQTINSPSAFPVAFFSRKNGNINYDDFLHDNDERTFTIFV